MRTGKNLKAWLAFSCLALGLLGCGTAKWKAHIENERGLALDGVERYADAEVHYLRAVGYDVNPEIPLTNLGRSKTMAAAYSEAHQHFEQAMLIAPALYDPHFNDGVALYHWGSQCGIRETVTWSAL